VRELLEEFGVLKDGRFDEFALCHSPQERLFLHGRWQEGLEPEIAATRRDREQYQRFASRMAEFHATGQFTIPMERGVDRRSPLDRISMAEWLRAERFDSPYLLWYVDYACRDDYGGRLAETSAWAGIHYFASREGEEKGPLTWPEGNGYLVRKLLTKIGKYVQANAMVRCIRPHEVWTEQVRYLTDAVIFAAPTFTAPYLIEGMLRVREFAYSPWLTANLTLDRWPRERDTQPAWDNVIYDSPALGYVVATHQSLRSHIEKTVWTFYWAMGDRKVLLERDWGWWKEAILNDLTRAHPDIRSCVARVDIHRMGHAMIRPAPGFLSSPERARFARGERSIFFANSDLSGLSLFEEAQDRGVRAAKKALARVGGVAESETGC
jgi:hypothetical protein